MADLTVVLLTVNKVPAEWAGYHKEVLLKAAGNLPIISISKKPIDIGTNYIDESSVMDIENQWRQLLRAAKLADTEYIGLAEDDTLYGPDHFTLRPPFDAFGYNLNRFSLYTWGEPLFSFSTRMVGATLIAPRKLLIEALDERFAKGNIPLKHNSEPGTCERKIGVTERKTASLYSFYSTIQFNHDYFSGHNFSEEDVKRRHRKRMAFVRANEIPYWGRAEDLVRKFR